MSGMKIVDWRPLRRNTLLGFATVEMPSGMVMAEIGIMRADRGEWAAPPSKPQIDRDGVGMKDAAGKLKYTPIISFTSKEVRDRFSNAVIEALRAAHPEVFAP
jgi:hypothetical protein